MASDSLSERDPSFNQLSPSSCSCSSFFSQCMSKLELIASLLAKAEALTSVALNEALEECTILQRHHYLATLDELVTAASEQVDDVLISQKSNKKK